MAEEVLGAQGLCLPTKPMLRHILGPGEVVGGKSRIEGLSSSLL